MRYLTIALTKGRLAYQTLELLEKVGITCDEMKNKDTRKLFSRTKSISSVSSSPKVRMCRPMWSTAQRISESSERTRFWRKEDASTRYWTLATASAACVSADRNPRVSCCSTTSRSVWQRSTQTLAKDYFYNRKHQTVEMIKLNGSIELAPIVGLSEVIVDIVETGSTLRENGLTVLEEVCPLSARMVVNQVSMRMENERITKLIQDLKGALV